MPDSYPGQAGLTAASSHRNVEQVHRQRDMDERRYMVPVRVIAVHGGGVGPAPTLDVVPVIHGVSGSGDKYEHGTVYGVPAARNHSASGTIISDPVVGDMGMLHVADRDIGTWKATGQPSMPESSRRGGLGDGIFHGAACNPGTPKQYLLWKPGGGAVVMDQNGGRYETFSDHTVVDPPSKGIIYLGGDPAEGGTFAPVQTTQGPSSNVYAKVG